MKQLEELLYVLALVACALLATATNQCGGDVGSPPLEDAGTDASPSCHPPGIVFSCDAPGIDCSSCPSSCTWTTDAGSTMGECLP